MTPFGVSWDSLTLERLGGFLAKAGGEPQTWEAKSYPDKPNSGGICRAVCGFANSEHGGYLILGARQDKQAVPQWTLPGDAFPNEPALWVGQVIRTGMRPVPVFEAKVFPVADGGPHVVVVRIQPVSEPPCITSAGVIHLRVGSETIPVNDPAVLARLLRRGDTARTVAEDAVRRAVEELGGPPAAAVSPRIALGIRAVAYPETLSQTLFGKAFATTLRQAAQARLPQAHDNHEPLQVTIETAPDFVAILNPRATPGRDYRWIVRCHRDGTVAVLCILPPTDYDYPLGITMLMEEVMRPAWRVAATLAVELGGTGHARFVLHSCGTEPVIAAYATSEDGKVTEEVGPLPLNLSIEEWLPLAAPSDGDLDAVRLKLLRALGVPGWQALPPAPDHPAT